MLFIMYINEIDDGFPCEILKFTDDTKILEKMSAGYGLHPAQCTRSIGMIRRLADGV